MKVHAKISCPVRPVLTAPAVWQVDFTLLTGEARSDQVSLNPGSFSSEDHLRLKLKQKLVEYLNVLYTPEVFHMNDVVLFGS